MFWKKTRVIVSQSPAGALGPGPSSVVSWGQARSLAQKGQLVALAHQARSLAGPDHHVMGAGGSCSGLGVILEIVILQLPAR